MSYINLLKVALRAILSNKFRSFLSMLGIIIGVAAVIIMMAIGQGSKENVKSELSKMGTNLLTIRPGAERRFAGARPDPASMQTLKDEDVEAIRREATLITYVSAEVSASGQVIYGNKNTTA
ncbi:MAG: ABC transporter permease, partial [Bacteroidaceae bacterium]|nr:ABC transporter permease [Bacteroidaceae bacterium]